MIADWSVPFELTSRIYSGALLGLNQVIPGLGIFLLRPEGCSLRNNVRAGKEFVPQSDGAILHRRFVGGMEIDLAIQLWQDTSVYACDELRQNMLDILMGYLYNLLNAEDNDGRISWLSEGAPDQRMLDDIRLLTYPAVAGVGGQGNAGIEVTVTLDCELPYEEDLTPQVATLTDTITVGGNRPVFPVYRIHGPTSAFTIQIATDDASEPDSFITYDSGQPGGQAIGPAQYAEINTFRNTVFLNGDQDNLLPNIGFTNTDFLPLKPGLHTIAILGAPPPVAEVEWNDAWA